ncbi:MAG: hypothetical protein WCC08_09620 [Terrimicrobiaceae bacterium]
MANEFFANPKLSIRGWERAIDAQQRVVSAVEQLLENHHAPGIAAIVSHGADANVVAARNQSLLLSIETHHETRLLSLCIISRGFDCARRKFLFSTELSVTPPERDHLFHASGPVQ